MLKNKLRTLLKNKIIQLAESNRLLNILSENPEVLKLFIENMFLSKSIQKDFETLFLRNSNTMRNIVELALKESNIAFKTGFIELLSSSLGSANMQVSFSQSGEDLIVDYIFKSLKISKPTYIDIGAYDPLILSNTMFFYQRGSRGITIEPNPDAKEKFALLRPEDINLNIGIANKSSELTYFHMDSPTMNTFSEQTAEEYVKKDGFQILKREKIKVDTLHNVIEKHNKGVFPDYLSLDVEGLDSEIIESINFQENSPKVICIETISYSDKGLGEKSMSLIKLIESKGYLLYADTNINSIFVKKDLWER